MGQLDELLVRQTARLCRDAGANPEAIVAWAEEGRRRRAIAKMPPMSGGCMAGGVRRPIGAGADQVGSRQREPGVMLTEIGKLDAVRAPGLPGPFSGIAPKVVAAWRGRSPGATGCQLRESRLDLAVVILAGAEVPALL